METKKPTNPKDALGVKKAPLHLIPTGPMYEVGLAMLEGGRKYGAHNYRAVGTRASVYYDAAKRHLDAWWEGEDIDPDSGIHHLMKAAACLFVQRDSQIMGNDVDDRPIKYPYCLPLDKFNKQAAGIVEKYQKCAKPFTEKGKTSDDKNGRSLDAIIFDEFDLSRTERNIILGFAYGASPYHFGTMIHQNIEDNEPEEFEGFNIKRQPLTSFTKDLPSLQWYISPVYAVNLYLHKDLKLHGSTGWSEDGGYGETPGYYKTKDEARDTIRAYKDKPVYAVKTLYGYGWYADRVMNNHAAYLYPDLKWYSVALSGNSDYKTGAWHPTKEIAEAYLKAYKEKHSA